MIIRHTLPYKAYTKIDRYVFTNPDLTDGAKVLYGYLCGLRNGAAFSDNYIKKALKTSQSVLTRRKKELKAADLILVEQISPKVYVVYIGHTKLPATEVKKNWSTEDNL